MLFSLLTTGENKYIIVLNQHQKTLVDNRKWNQTKDAHERRV